jgi:CubicO group peptidase (beta-lactamase class C family)
LTAAAAPAIEGTCAPGFEVVREAFRENFQDQGEVGAGVAVVRGGEVVVDLWGGFADSARTRPWERDTVVTTYSTTKGMTALCAHVLADQGRLDFDAPVARYWPEFAAAGKEVVRVRHLLAHTAGVPAIRAPLPREAIFDWERMTTALAGEAPWWAPGAKMGYHSVTYGFLVGEVVRRVSGVSIGAFLASEIAGPMGERFFIGFGAEHDALVAEAIAATDDPLAALAADGASLAAKVFFNPPAHNADRSIANTRAWRGAEIPSVNGHGTARALARIYAALAASRGLLSEAGVERCAAVEVEGMDVVLGREAVRTLGFVRLPFGGPRTFGHPGQGGSIGFADPENGVGFGYVPNQMRMGPDDIRARRLIEAAYGCL